MRTRLRKALLWGALLVLSALGGGLWAAYSYVTDSATLAAIIQKEAPKFLPGSRLQIDRVMLRPLVGDVELKQVFLWQTIDGTDFLAARIPWLQVRHSFRELLHGRFVPSEVDVALATVRIRRRKDGTWNLQGLLADPWPGSPLAVEPTVVIRNGTVELADDEGKVTAVLREVELTLQPGAGGAVRFDGSARGGPFDRLKLAGTLDRKTGRVELDGGDLSRLAIGDALWDRLPADWRALAREAGLKGGELDVAIDRLRYEPGPSPRLSYSGSVALRSGTWDCPEHLPFRLDDLEAKADVRDGEIVLKSASARNGRTEIRARGRLSGRDPANGPMALHVEVIDLELDGRLKAKTPPDLRSIWDEYRPSGRVNVALDAVRRRPGEKPGVGLTVDCLDVAMEYHMFKYPLEHVRGTLKCRESLIEVDMATTVAGAPLTCKGKIEQPGKPEAVVDLAFAAGSMPIDEALLRALPPDAAKVVREFHPSGSVRGTTRVVRTPPRGPLDDPEVGHIDFDCDLELNPGASMVWDGLKYPVDKMTGRLRLKPDRWTFTEMRGTHGLARIAASGEVTVDAQQRREVKLSLVASRLQFDEVLRQALPEEWRATWATLNPSGSSGVRAAIHVGPGRKDQYHLEVEPEPGTSIRLVLSPVTPKGTPDVGTIALPKMEDVRGTFVFDDGDVRMGDVRFTFREAPVSFKGGKVAVRDRGAFNLEVEDVEVRRLKLDVELQKLMPPVMALFCRRLDNGKPFSARGNLGISWSGRTGEPAVCRWDHARVVLIDNAIQAGLPVEHLQGEVTHISGRSDGQSIACEGILNLASAGLLGQQVTKLETPIEVKDGKARLTDIQGKLLEGEVRGKVEISLDTTPRYAVRLDLREARLERYGRTVPGHQAYRGKVSGWIDVTGLGNDLKNLQGDGHAEINEGDLGKLPIALRLFKAVNLSGLTKTAFDSAYVDFRVQGGLATLKPVKLTGNAFSLQGQGTVDLQGDIDLRLHPLYGRDERLHLGLLSDALRELSGQFFAIRVTGSPAMPQFGVEPVPDAAERLGRVAEGVGKGGRRIAREVLR